MFRIFSVLCLVFGLFVNNALAAEKLPECFPGTSGMEAGKIEVETVRLKTCREEAEKKHIELTWLDYMYDNGENQHRLWIWFRLIPKGVKFKTNPATAAKIQTILDKLPQPASTPPP